MKAIFLDRDGTIIQEAGDGVIDDPGKIYLFPEVEEAMRLLAPLDYRTFIVTNEIGIAQGRLTKERFVEINHQLLLKLAELGVHVEYTFFCPHPPADNCDCRKPRPGMIKQAQERYPDLVIEESWVVGDKLHDAGLGKAVGAQTILVNRNGTAAEGTADYVVPDLLAAAQVIANPLPGSFTP
jgi:D-glycero-D-manno-heptose 1,7-bisphosphate phosphatase